MCALATPANSRYLQAISRYLKARDWRSDWGEDWGSVPPELLTTYPVYVLPDSLLTMYVVA